MIGKTTKMAALITYEYPHVIVIINPSIQMLVGGFSTIKKSPSAIKKRGQLSHWKHNYFFRP